MKKAKKIIFVKNEGGSIAQAMDLDLYLKQRRAYGTKPSVPVNSFLVGVAESPKAVQRKSKKCCGKKK